MYYLYQSGWCQFASCICRFFMLGLFWRGEKMARNIFQILATTVADIILYPTVVFQRDADHSGIATSQN